MADAVLLSPPELSGHYGNWIKRAALRLKARMPWAELDELLQWGAVGMMEAQSRFNNERGVPFEAYAARRIQGAMIDGLRRGRQLRRLEAEADEQTIDNAALAGGSTPDDPCALLLRAELRDLLVTALKTLPLLEYQILALHFYEGLNNREIAATLDISEGYATRIRQRALLNLNIYMKAKLKGAANA